MAFHKEGFDDYNLIFYFLVNVNGHYFSQSFSKDVLLIVSFRSENVLFVCREKCFISCFLIVQ